MAKRIQYNSKEGFPASDVSTTAIVIAGLYGREIRRGEGSHQSEVECDSCASYLIQCAYLMTSFGPLKSVWVPSAARRTVFIWKDLSAPADDCPVAFKPLLWGRSLRRAAESGQANLLDAS